MTPNRRRTIQRPGFSLVELLVVIAIIAILASLSIWGVTAMVGNRTKNNTEATIRVLHKTLQTRWAAVIADSRKEAPSPVVMNLAGNDLERARVIWAKVRLCEAFPIAFKELNPTDATTIVNTYIPANRLKPHFVKYRTTITSYPAVPGATESSACLLMALRTMQADGLAIDDQLKHTIQDTDGDTIPEFVDAWGKPLAFFRFPWNDAALQASNPAAANSASFKFADSTDPTGKLIDNKLAMNWYKTTAPINYRAIFEATFHPTMITASNNAYYTTPVIASAGRDGVMALGPDMSSAGAGSADNIYSFQLRLD